MKFAARHALGQQAEEIADAHGRLQNAPALEAHVAERVVDGADNSRRGVVRVERGAARGLVFFGREGCFQLGVLLRPVAFVLVKGVGNTAPTGVAGKRLLLVRGCCAPLGLNLL